MKTIGKNTAIVVRVEATTADATSVVPSLADWITLRPCSLFRTMFSRTTIELSTSIPTARAMPPNDMMFNDMSFMYIKRNVPMTDTGIAIATVAVARESRRKPYRTKIAINPPRIAAVRTASTADEINVD